MVAKFPTAVSNLPAPFDPNLLPVLRSSSTLPYAHEIFLTQAEVQADDSLSEGDELQLRLVEGDRHELELRDAANQRRGRVTLPGQEILARLLDAGKALKAVVRLRIGPNNIPLTRVGIYLVEL